MENKNKVVGIVGAGVSGLLACKYSLSKGFKTVVFETQSSIGGVWAKTLETTHLQTATGMYRFSDLPWPESVTELLPRHDKVLDYIKSYARHFDLVKHIHFNSKVVRIDFEGRSVTEEEVMGWSTWGGNGEAFSSDGKWILTVEDTRNLSTEVYEVDFLILCVGRFKDAPDIPEFPLGKGPESFRGKVVHSSDYSAMDYEAAAEFVKGKNVVVVGLQKSGMDIAMECSAANGVEHPCTIVYRSNRWKFIDYTAWGFPIANLFFNRFSELIVHKPGEGFLLSLLATFLSPLRWAISKFVETDLKRRLPLLKYNLVPDHRFSEDVKTCLIAVMPGDFFKRVDKGSIKLKKAPSFSFCNEGILVDGEDESIKADIVILATGFKGVEKLKDAFVSPTFQHCIASSPNSRVPLYREIIHPRIPQLAIIGFSESISNLFTSEMRCRWLMELLTGTVKVPSTKEMEKDIAEWDEYMKQSSVQYYKRSCIGALHIWYNDQLCKDMGWNPKRKKNLWAEWFEPYGPMDYGQP